jgi:predicted nucleic acid-binding protein
MRNSLVCVDASLIIRTLVPAPLSEEAIVLLEKWYRDRRKLIAPSLLAFEITSILRRLVCLKDLTPSEGEETFEHFQQIEISLSSRRSIFSLAWQLAKELNRPRAYDTAYLALAQLKECDFWTADEKLYNVVDQKLDWVHWVGNL